MTQIHQSNGESSSLFQPPTYPARPIQVWRILRFWRLSELTFQLCYLPTIWLWTSYLTIIIQELVMDREAWRAAVHGVTKSWTWLSDWTEWDFAPPFIKDGVYLPRGWLSHGTCFGQCFHGTLVNLMQVEAWAEPLQCRLPPLIALIHTVRVLSLLKDKI